MPEKINFSEIEKILSSFQTLIKLKISKIIWMLLRKEGNSIGARINVMASNVPAGLGEPVFDRIDADIAKAMMSINAVKAVNRSWFFVSYTKGY